MRRSYIGTIVLMTVKNTTLATKVGLLIAYYITLSFWSAQTLCLSMVSRNIAGQTKKATVVAMTFISWSAGNAIGKHLCCTFSNLKVILNAPAGPQVFLDWDAPRYHIAWSVHLACYACLTVAVIFLRFYLMRQNKRKDEFLAGAEMSSADPNLDHAFEDKTDQENLNFRYVY